LLESKYGRRKRGIDFCAYVNRETLKAGAVAAISRAMAAQQSTTSSTRERLAGFSSSASPFDGPAASAGAAGPATRDSSAVVAPPAPGPDDPARYAKVRQILVGEGVSGRIVDAAIRE